MIDKRWQIVVIQTSDGKLHEMWRWQLDYYLMVARNKRENDNG